VADGWGLFCANAALEESRIKVRAVEMRMRLGNHLADHGRKLASTRQDNIQQTKGEGRFTNPEVES